MEYREFDNEEWPTIYTKYGENLLSKSKESGTKFERGRARHLSQIGQQSCRVFSAPRRVRPDDIVLSISKRNTGVFR